MIIGRVVGSVVCTVKAPSLDGERLLVVRLLDGQTEKDLTIACDATQQAGIGDTVYLIGRTEAALVLNPAGLPPADLAIAGIIDPETLR